MSHSHNQTNTTYGQTHTDGYALIADKKTGTHYKTQYTINKHTMTNNDTDNNNDNNKRHRIYSPGSIGHISFGNSPNKTLDDENNPETKREKPTHKCIQCETEVRIQSETRKRAPNFCKECVRITSHQRLD